MRVFITRPEPDALRTAQVLKDVGHEVFIVPLLTISISEDVSFSDISPQGLLITSANGLRAFAQQDKRRDISVYAVGAASAQEAARYGFQTIHQAAGDVSSLTTLVVRLVDPQAGPLLHVSGGVVSGTLSEMLEGVGFKIIRRVAYQAEAVPDLPAELSAYMHLVERERVTGILFFSARTANHFCYLVQRAGLGTSCHSMNAYCLSEAVQKALAPLHFHATYVAKDHTQEAIIALLGEG